MSMELHKSRGKAVMADISAKITINFFGNFMAALGRIFSAAEAADSASMVADNDSKAPKKKLIKSIIYFIVSTILSTQN